MSQAIHSERAVSALRSVIRAFNVVTKKLERRFGLSGSQLEVLECLHQHPGLSLSDLATRSLTDQSTMSIVVGRLVDRGLVAREQVEDDRRRARLSLTGEGEALLATAPASVSTRLRSGFSQLGETERTALTALLERWLSAAGLRRI
jgi:MarR family transcriptional regulator, organic hydroperoxide resistance regulator